MKVDKSEGDTNLSTERKSWIDGFLNDEVKQLLEEDAEYFIHQSLSTPCLNVLDSCDGSYIFDHQGRKYLDFHGNNVHQVGYKNKYVIDAVKRQLDILPFSPRRYTNIPAIRLAKKLTQIAPGNMKRVLFTPGGTGAIGIALKIARLVTGKFKTVSWWDSFHGASLDAISIGGEAHFRSGIGPLLPGAIHIPPPYNYKSPFGNGSDSALQSPEYLDYVMEREGDIAAFIAEPIRYTNVTIPSRSYWKDVRAICDKHKALLIFDEIPTCLGRSGRMFVTEHYDIYPDILCIGKGLGGGVFPMAAVLTRDEFNIAATGSLGHYTHEKSPLGSAAALASIEFIEKENILAGVAEKGVKFLESLNVLMKKHEVIGDLRGIGLMAALELVTDRDSGKPDEKAAEKVLYEAIKRGLSFKVSGGNVLSLMPPLTVSVEELDEATNILNEAFNSL